MNKKIYNQDNYILLSQQAIQPSANQLIVNTNEVFKETLECYIDDFIQQNSSKHLVLICNNVDSFFEELIKQFIHIEAAGGLIEQQDKYLFIYRLGKWDLPKGKIEIGEAREAAAIRECEEECGINKLEIINNLPSTFHIYPYKNKYALKTTYWYKMKSEDKRTLIPQLEENIEKAEWLSLADVQEKVIPNTYPSILDMIYTVLIIKN